MTAKVWLLAFVWFAGQARAQQDETIPEKVVDPTAPLPSVTLEIEHARTIQSRDGNLDTYSLAVANPYALWKRSNLLHVAIPYESGAAVSLPGVGAVLVTNLSVFNRPWGRWGIGLDAGISPPQPGRDGIQSGPAFGFVRVMGKCRAGVLNLNYFASGISLSAAQLIGGCALGDGWNVSLGRFTLLYNWRSGSMLEFPLSLQAGKVVTLAGQPLQLYFNPRYNLQGTPGTAQWTFAVGVTFVAALL